MDDSLLGSSVHRIFQARVLEWGAIAFSDYMYIYIYLNHFAVHLPGKFHGQRSLVGYGQWFLEKSDKTERLHFHFSLSCFGEGNGNPLQRSCLENPRDSGLPSMGSQSWTRLKRLSSSILHIYRSSQPRKL